MRMQFTCVQHEAVSPSPSPAASGSGTARDEGLPGPSAYGVGSRLSVSSSFWPEAAPVAPPVLPRRAPLETRDSCHTGESAPDTGESAPEIGELSTCAPVDAMPRAHFTAALLSEIFPAALLEISDLALEITLPLPQDADLVLEVLERPVRSVNEILKLGQDAGGSNGRRFRRIWTGRR